jgi:diaminohydroxyphosphoribosylaminopyrimidine deaminase/5-amino-6-(5-phosphoribosylamino)uracil reductase
VEAGVSRVVVGTVDPNPKVRGAGIEILRSAGIEVTVPCLEKECKWLNRGFFRSQTLGRPWITLKAASSLDGRMALQNGESQWITGEPARAWAHGARAEHDAVLAGSGTLCADDPALTARYACGKSPLRILLNTELSLPPNLRALNGSLVAACRGDAEKRRVLEEAGAEVCFVPEKDGRVNLEAAVAEFHARGILSLLVEGGPRVLSSFIAAGLCDAFLLFVAASVMGEGRGLGDPLRFGRMEDIVRLTDARTRRVGEDFLVEGLFRCSPAL